MITVSTSSKMLRCDHAWHQKAPLIGFTQRKMRGTPKIVEGELFSSWCSCRDALHTDGKLYHAKSLFSMLTPSWPPNGATRVANKGYVYFSWHLPKYPTLPVILIKTPRKITPTQHPSKLGGSAKVKQGHPVSTTFTSEEHLLLPGLLKLSPCWFSLYSTSRS